MHKEFDQLWILNDEVSKDLTIINNAIKAAVVVIIYKNTHGEPSLEALVNADDKEKAAEETSDAARADRGGQSRPEDYQRR